MATLATRVVRFGKDFAKEAAYDQAADAMGGQKSTGKPTWGGAGYDAGKAVATRGQGSHPGRFHQPTLGETLANRRLQQQQMKQDRRQGMQQATDAMNQLKYQDMNRLDLSVPQSVAYHYVADNEVYQDCCSVAIPAPQQESFMTGLEKMVFGANE